MKPQKRLISEIITYIIVTEIISRQKNYNEVKNEFTGSEKLIELRRINNLTQEQLADKVHVSRQAISKWERAEAYPDTDNLIALSRVFNVSLERILDYNYKGEEKTNNYEEKQNFTFKESVEWGD